MSEFAVGDRVTWSSQAKGLTRAKTGTVVGLVPAQMNLWKFIAAHEDQYRPYDTNNFALIPDSDACYRTAVSYLVAVTIQTSTGKIRRRQKLYWPRAEFLQRVVPAMQPEARDNCSLAELRRDALRYRWLCQQMNMHSEQADGRACWILGSHVLPRARSINEAIDAAMEKKASHAGT